MAVTVPFISTWSDRGLKAAERDMHRWSRAAKKIGDDGAKAFFNAGANMAHTAAITGRAGDTLTRNVTVPLVGIGVVSAKIAQDFGGSMKQVGAASGASGAELEKLTAYAREMGSTTTFSARESAAAMLELAKSGITPAQIQAGALKASLDLAAAGSVSLESAATTTANAINMFGLKAEDAASVANAFAGGANASSASVDSLQQALSQVGPGARNAGLSLNDTVGVLAAFADKGIQGSDAGTSLKVMLQRLIPQTDAAAIAMEKYGLSFVDAKGNFDSVTVVAQKLQDKLGKLSEAQRAEALQTMFGSDATRAATVLMQEGAGGIEKYISATKDRTAASKMAEAAMTDDARAVEEAQGAMEDAAITVGSALAPTIKDLAGTVKDVANGFSKLSPETQETVVKFAMAAAAAGPLLKGFSLVTSAGSQMAGMLGKLSMAQATAAASTTTTTTALSRFATGSSVAMMKFGPILAALAVFASEMKAVGGESEDYAAAMVMNGDSMTDIEQAVKQGKTSWDELALAVQQNELVLLSESEQMEILKNSTMGVALSEEDLMGSLHKATQEMSDGEIAIRENVNAMKDYRDELALTRDAQLGAEQADVALERAKLRLSDAQKRHEQAVAEFGPKSREAIDAELDLRDANLNLLDSQARVAEAQTKANDAMKRIPRPDFNNAKSWMEYYQKIGDKAAYAAAKINATFTGGTVKSASGRKNIPIYGTGGYVDQEHLAIVGDEPEIIFPLGDESFARQYLPILLGSLPDMSPNSTARRGSGVAVTPHAEPKLEVHIHRDIETYSQGVAAARGIREGLYRL